MSFPENLKRLREKKQLSQFELAEKCGITQQAIDRYERDLMKPNIIIGVNLAKALGTTCEEIVCGQTEV
jgi:transcriptional regulator with XRE-family HTH domain